MTSQFRENDYSPAARKIMGKATRAGVTRESIGQWMNLAARYQRWGNPAEAARCAAHAIAIHESWGALHASYSMGEGTLAEARKIADQLVAR